MKERENYLTKRDKEIIFKVAKSLGFESELNSDEQITKNRIGMILYNLDREGWKKDRLHAMGIPSLGLIRACTKVSQELYKCIPRVLRPSFPTRNEEYDSNTYLHLTGWEKESIREYIIFF